MIAFRCQESTGDFRRFRGQESIRESYSFRKSIHPVLIPFANSLLASSKKKRLGGKHIKAVDNAVLPSEQKLCYLGNVLSWRGTTAAHKPG